MGGHSPGRTSLLRSVGECLMRLASAASAAAAAAAISDFLDAQRPAWHTLDAFDAGHLHRQVLSRHRPRGYVQFVRRFGLLKRPDGVYQGKYGDAILLMVKAASPSRRGQCLVCALGLPKTSSLNDAAALACLGGLLHEALFRVFCFEADGRRDALLDMAAESEHSVLAVFDQAGSPVECHPGDVPLALRHAFGQCDRSGGGVSTLPPVRAVVVGDGATVYEGEQRWVGPESPLHNRFRLLRATKRGGRPAGLPMDLSKYGLSKRELQVAQLLFSGRTNHVIARDLFISPDTVKTHCRHIYRKIGIVRRSGLLELLSGLPPHAGEVPAPSGPGANPSDS
jgi:DNA-binding CsgD family transcriptional regulator